MVDKELSSFKGIKSFTVLSKVTPFSLDKAFKEELIKVLRVAGQVTPIDLGKSMSENFGAAMKDATFLILSAESMIEDSSPASYKTIVQLSLRVVSGYKINESQEVPPQILWEQQVPFEFSSDGKVLLDRGIQSVKSLTDQFTKSYLEMNPASRPIFYIL